tara:strand:- start:30 stop:206 length:177 start_codon:yes stop_codon:yes gene_type:complete
MKMIIVIIAILIQGDEAKFILKESGFRSMFECEKRVATAHGPRLVCAEVPAAYLRRKK